MLVYEKTKILWNNENGAKLFKRSKTIKKLKSTILYFILIKIQEHLHFFFATTLDPK